MHCAYAFIHMHVIMYAWMFVSPFVVLKRSFVVVKDTKKSSHTFKHHNHEHVILHARNIHFVHVCMYHMYVRMYIQYECMYTYKNTDI